VHRAAVRYDVIRAREAGLDARTVEHLTGVPARSQRRILYEEVPFAMSEQQLRADRCVGRPSTLSPSFRQLIDALLGEEPPPRTSELLRRLRSEHGYTEGKNPVYAYVAAHRPPPPPPLPVVRFEGVAGEFAQHDFGSFTVTYTDGRSEKLTFYAGRLKYSRALHVCLVAGETTEGFIRGMEAAAGAWGGLPLLNVIDNTRAAIRRRHREPGGPERIEYNATFATFLREVGVFAEPTYPYSANQKGSVESLVKFVKGAFLMARRFRHREDLLRQLGEWLAHVNFARPCDATGVIPARRLRDEQPHLRPLPFGERGFGMPASAVVRRDGFVRWGGYGYSTPAAWIGQVGDGAGPPRARAAPPYRGAGRSPAGAGQRPLLALARAPRGALRQATGRPDGQAPDPHGPVPGRRGVLHRARAPAAEQLAGEGPAGALGPLRGPRRRAHGGRVRLVPGPGGDRGRVPARLGRWGGPMNPSPELTPLSADLRQLRLPTIRRRYPELEERARAEGWSYSEYLERLAAEEVAYRREVRIARATRRAGFPFLKTLEEFDFTFQRSIQRPTLGPYLGAELVSGGRNLILWGTPGLGKTALCIALAYKAIQQGATARFVTCTELIGELVQARARGEWDRALTGYLAPEVLVVDEVGYLTYGPYAANTLFPVVDKRYLAGNRPILLTTNKDPSTWGAVLHDPDLSAAILDRLLHRGELLKLTGRSYRQHRPGELPDPPEGGPGE